MGGSSAPSLAPEATGPGASDVALADGVAAGDPEALAELYRRYGGNCLALARRVLGDEARAEEVVQEVFVRLWRDPARFDADRGTMRSWLCAQAHGRAVDLVRSEEARRSREERDAAFAVVEIDLEREVVRLVEADATRRALATLSEGERVAIETAYFGGHTYRDAARLLGEPEGTVKARIRSGLLLLRAALIDAGIGDAGGGDVIARGPDPTRGGAR